MTVVNEYLVVNDAADLETISIPRDDQVKRSSRLGERFDFVLIYVASSTVSIEHGGGCRDYIFHPCLRVDH